MKITIKLMVFAIMAIVSFNLTGCATHNAQNKVYSEGPSGSFQDNSLSTSQKILCYEESYKTNSISINDANGTFTENHSTVSDKALKMPFSGFFHCIGKCAENLCASLTVFIAPPQGYVSGSIPVVTYGYGYNYNQSYISGGGHVKNVIIINNSQRKDNDCDRQSGQRYDNNNNNHQGDGDHHGGGQPPNDSHQGGGNHNGGPGH